ncbi:MAG TPA: hypothetical protein VN969_19160 [Streptosporangiaceae bacterium]|jgi:hypothetical protein|nr:hypothetical protein [Streptosporangiaceae bacterium]
MGSIRSAGAVLALAGFTTLAGVAAPAFAAGPTIYVSPSVAAPGSSVFISAVCVASDGKNPSTSATLFGTTLGIAEHIPMSASTHKGVFGTMIKLPSWIKAGSYSPSVDCSNGWSGTAMLTVAAAKPAVVVPSGAPVTGDGITSTAVGGPITAVGIGILGLSGIFGALFVNRRRKANAAK